MDKFLLIIGLFVFYIFLGLVVVAFMRAGGERELESDEGLDRARKALKK
jgi:hypothetical protein